MNSNLTNRIKVWDLPTRLFHWLLVALFIAAWITAEQGPAWMERHMQIGYALLTLLLFRLLWGIYGSDTARFSRFLRGPVTVTLYLAALLRREPESADKSHMGHNPLGGWSVIAMLVFLLLQAGTGLFANDDIYNEGPLASWVNNATSGELTRIHKLNFNLLLGLIGLHISAILFYLLVKRENLVWPMFTGFKAVKQSGQSDASADQPDHNSEHQPTLKLKPPWLAMLSLLASSAAVWLLVSGKDLIG